MSVLRRFPFTLAILVLPIMSHGQDKRENPATTNRSPSIVEIVTTEKGFELRRNGEPYFIRGVGGRAQPEQLPAAGGNSVRTWHARGLGRALDRAHELGLTVCAGIWLPHEKENFDYANAEQVARLVEHAKETVLAHRDHPALLLWGVGNEMEGSGRKPAIWQAVNQIAKTIKAADPHHPTITVIAGTGKNKLRQIAKYCPDIDLVGINAYGDLKRIAPALARQEMSMPYLITEFGPFGWWQTGKTSWGAELEPTSTEKAKTYLASYEAAVASQPGKCLGSYAFLWGDKQEHTHTWFGMFLPNGMRTAAVDAMTKAWTGNWPADRCPKIEKIKLAPRQDAPAEPPAEHIYAPGTELIARVAAEDPEGGALNYEWELRSESSDKRTGGFREEVPAAHPDAIVGEGGPEQHVRLPDKPGAYRLFVIVADRQKNAATTNVPILVR